MKKYFRLPNTLTIIFFLIIITAVCTWFVPSGQFTRQYSETAQRELIVPNSYKETPPNHQGVMAVLTALAKGLQDAGDVVAFILIIGGAFGVVNKTGAVNSGVNALIKKLGNRDMYLILIIMLIFSIGGTLEGTSEETIPFYIILVPLLAMAGYDRLVGMLVVFLGAAVGTMASTINPFATGIASAIAEITIKDGIMPRVVIYAISMLIAITFVVIYARKVKKDPSKTFVTENLVSSEPLKAEEMPPFNFANKLIIIGLVVVLALLAYGVMSLGWWLDEIGMLFLALALFAGIISKIGEKALVNSFVDGAKDLLGVALVIGSARGIMIIAQNGHIIDTILYHAANSLSGLPKPIFLICNQLVQELIAFIVPSSSGQAALTISLMAPLSDILQVKREFIVTAMQSASGLVNMITPTNGVLMAALGITGLSYGKWLRFILPMFVVLNIVTIAVLVLSLYF